MTVKEFFSKGLDCEKSKIECYCIESGRTKTGTREGFLKMVKLSSEYRNAEIIGSAYDGDVLHLDIILADGINKGLYL